MALQTIAGRGDANLVIDGKDLKDREERRGDRGDGDRALRKAEGGMALENEVAIAELTRTDEKRRGKSTETPTPRRWEEPT